MTLLAYLYWKHQAHGHNGRGQMEYINGFDWLPNRSSGRSLGTTILSARGSGKSLPTFKEMCWGDLLLGIPQLILDPVGSSAYLLDKVWRAKDWLSKEQWWQVVNRMVYLDFGAQEGFTPSWPLLYRLGNESAYEVASRPIDMIAALSPHLESAAVEGMNSIREMATHAGIVLSALELQLTELESLLTQTKRWDKEWGLLEKAVQRESEAKQSVEFLRRFSKLKLELQDRRTKSLLNQMRMLQLDPTMRAIFGSTTVPPWQAWEEQGTCVIVDFQHVRDLDRRRWCMNAVYDAFMAYKLSRGLRSTPWSLVLEEFTQWIPSEAAGDPMTAKFDALLNVYGRNYQIYITTISQELFQLPLRLQEVLLAAGNIMIGNQASAEGRKILADYFFPYTPDGLPPKRVEPVYAGQEIVDYRAVDWSQAEHRALASQAFAMPGFHFLVRAAKREGDVGGDLQQMVVRRNVGEWVQEDKVALLRQLLVKHSGLQREEMLAEIDSRLHSLLQSERESATLAPVTPPAENDPSEPANAIPVEVASTGYVPGAAFRLQPAREGEAHGQDGGA